MVKRLSGSCAAAALLMCAACALAEESATRSYPLPDHGALQLNVPKSWREEVKQPPDGEPPTITFRPARGEAFQIMVTPVYPPRAGMPMPALAAVKADVEKAAAQAAPQAAERRLAIHDIRGPGGAGYYFSATDKAPAPGEYRLMTQAELLAGGVVPVMTALSNDASGAVQSQALEMIKSARHRPPEQGIAVSSTPQGYELTVPVSRLVMTLPAGHLEQADGPEGAAAGSPRYFYFRDRAQGLILSGWFEPADSYPGVQTFWKNETAGWKKNGLPDPVDVSFEKSGNWDTVAYDMAMPVPHATDAHLRAEYVQAGTWIDLHLSMTSSLPSAQAREKLLGILKTIIVREKQQ